jgi:UDP-3-O-[3-hydroxymyristoyl] N-acetylglucosamine deacetylase
VIEIGRRPQRSLARSVDVAGVGFVTGARVALCFRPAPADTGIVFHRIDQRRPEPIRATADAVTGTQRRTTIGRGQNSVTLAEHVMAALSGMRIDNCIVELDGPEPPGLDGSAAAFVDAIVDGGIVLQNSRRPVWTVDEPVVLKQGGASLSFYPADDGELRLTYLLDYGLFSSIPPQLHTETITPERFQHEIAAARTFLLEDEARELQQQGVGRHLTPGELLVFGAHGPINNVLRRPNEPARHKLLDLIGDLALCGLLLAGRVVAYRSGHPLNVEMARALSRLVRRNGMPAPMRLAA